VCRGGGGGGKPCFFPFWGAQFRKFIIKNTLIFKSGVCKKIKNFQKNKNPPPPPPPRHTVHLPAVNSITTFRINRLFRRKNKKYSLVHYPQNPQEKTTSVHTPFTIQCKGINSTNEISFINKPCITLYLFLVLLDIH